MKHNVACHIKESINLKTTEFGELLTNNVFLQNQLKLCGK